MGKSKIESPTVVPQSKDLATAVLPAVVRRPDPYTSEAIARRKATVARVNAEHSSESDDALMKIYEEFQKF